MSSCCCRCQNRTTCRGGTEKVPKGPELINCTASGPTPPKADGAKGQEPTGSKTKQQKLISNGSQLPGAGEEVNRIKPLGDDSPQT